MKKIKVLHAGLSYRPGGIESFLLNYSKFINNNKIEMDYINVFEGTNTQLFYKTLNERGNVYNLPDYRRHPVKFIIELKKLQNRNQYDVFHYNMNSAVYLLPLIAAKICRIKIIIAHSHNSSSDKGILKSILHNIFKMYIPFLANTYFACSELAGKWFFSKNTRIKKNYFIINNAIELGKFKYDSNSRQEKRNEFSIKNDTIVLGHIGRFKKQKNHEFLIDIFKEYNQLNRNSILMLIGFGPLEEKVKIKVKEYGLEDKVLFLGERFDVEKLVQAMDIFILPSLYEGLPLVGVEAQTSGVPCIFSDSITEQLKLNSNVKFISLRKSAYEWAKILFDLNYFRINPSVDKFDIEKNSIILENIYFNLVVNKNEKRK